VATPIAWDELTRDVRFDHYNVGNVPKRLARAKSCPWQDMDSAAVALDKSIMARVGYKLK
jgi:DNA primase